MPTTLLWIIFFVCLNGILIISLPLASIFFFLLSPITGLADSLVVGFVLYFTLPNLLILAIPGPRLLVKVLLYIGILCGCIVAMNVVY